MKNRKYSILICKKCGKEMKVRNDYIKKHSGVCMSCQKKGNKIAKKHGDYKERLYHIWLGLSHRRYKNHKPIVCDEWKNDYLAFKEWSLKNGYNDNLTIDRINNDGNYEPNNCQWITLQENARKDKVKYNHKEKVEIFNLRKRLNITQIQMANLLGVSRNTIQRLEKEIKEERKNKINGRD